MKLTIFGTGYVGLVTGTCFAEMGNDVLCMDVDTAKIEALRQGRIPIFEPGLTPMVQRNVEAGTLGFTSDAAEAVAHGEVVMIAVGTPPAEDGSADLQHVLAVAETVARHATGRKIVVDKSTVPVGTADRVKAAIERVLAERAQTEGTLDAELYVASNPEFLKEGAAVADFMKPDRIIVGADAPEVFDAMRALYAPFNRNHDRVLEMDIRSAELTKYAANVMLATKISLMNELSNLADRLGADVEQVRRGMGSDPRIGYHFIYPGAGYGGSCFPKDVKALASTARGVGYVAELIEAVERVNERQKSVLFEKISAHFDGALQGRCIALWGLAFKPNTDDVREAPSRVLMEALWAAGARVQAYDPVAMDEIRHIYGDRADLRLVDDRNAALDGADALAIVTEWNEFRSPDFDTLRDRLRHAAVFDGRNLYEPELLEQRGIAYYAIGRGRRFGND
jgi:UDPglucose 6-dehydrogenase